GCNPTSSKFIHTWLRFGEIMRGSLSAQLGFALGYYCHWCRKNRNQRKKWGDWVTCLSLAILAQGPLFNYLQ
ncbi:hypothetical protein ACIPDU_10470, partial [Escherichia coli]